MDKPLKTVLITGGSSGIGLAVSQNLDKQNYLPINIDIKPPQVQSNIPYLHCDISNSQDINNLYSNIIEKYGNPSVLISNAGINVHELISEGDPAKWQRVMEVNVVGAMQFIRAFINDLPKGKGHIIFVSSVAARKNYKYGGIYSASKAALETFAETLRLEVQPHIKVSVIAAGAINTPFFENTLGGPQDYAKLPYSEVSAMDIARHVQYVLSVANEVNVDYSVLRPHDQDL